jgi:hypothetical protein
VLKGLLNFDGVAGLGLSVLVGADGIDDGLLAENFSMLRSFNS